MPFIMVFSWRARSPEKTQIAVAQQEYKKALCAFKHSAHTKGGLNQNTINNASIHQDHAKLCVVIDWALIIICTSVSLAEDASVREQALSYMYQKHTTRHANQDMNQIGCNTLTKLCGHTVATLINQHSTMIDENTTMMNGSHSVLISRTRTSGTPDILPRVAGLDNHGLLSPVRLETQRRARVLNGLLSLLWLVSS